MNHTGVRSTGSRRQRANEQRLGHGSRLAPACNDVPAHPVAGGPLAVRWLALRARPRAAPARSRAPRSSSRTPAPPPGTSGIALLPLARRARQPDRVGRDRHAAPAARPGRADDRRARGPCGRSRPARTGSRSTSSSSTASGSRRSATSRSRSRPGVARDGPAVARIPARSSLEEGWRRAVSTPTPRATPSSAGRSTAPARAARQSPAPGRIPASRTRCSARR